MVAQEDKNFMERTVVKVTELLDSTLRQAGFVGFLTWLLAFGYQIVFYFFYATFERTVITGRETVFSYSSGIVGDGFLVPITNVLAFLVIKKLEYRTNRYYLSLACGMGMVFTFAAHYLQAALALTNWSMPTPFHWSGVGVFHFFFMLTETSFLFYVLVLVFYKYKKLLADNEALLYLGLTILVLLAFGGTFLADYLAVFRQYAFEVHQDLGRLV